MNNPSTDIFMTVKETAKYFNVSESWLYKKIEAGKIPVYKIGRLKVKLSEVEVACKLNKLTKSSDCLQKDTIKETVWNQQDS